MRERMKVSLLTYTPDAQRVVAAAASNCYSSDGPISIVDNIDDAKAEKLLSRVASMGHDSVFEHAVFTFGAENVSRSLMAQLTRHRVASFSVKSQRYVGESDFGYIAPPSVTESSEAMEVFNRAMNSAEEAYRVLTQMGIPKEDARFVLPNACCTHIVITMNARELNHFFRLRLCNRAQWEIRELAGEMLRLAHDVAPLLFRKAGPGCVYSGCTEGKLSCGRAGEVREKFLALSNSK